MDQSIGYLIALPFILLIVGWRLWRGSRQRRLRIERMWIGPAIFLVIILAAVISLPPPDSAPIYAALVAAFALGLATGWFRGRTVRVAIDVETHALTSQSSPWGMVIFVGLLLFRLLLRYEFAEHSNDWRLSASTVTDGFLIFYGGMIIAMRLEIWLRARKLLADAIAAGASGETVSDEVSESRD